MKRIILLLLCFLCGSALIAQVKSLNLLFAPGQLQLTTYQKQVIDSMTNKMADGQRLVIYPLTYDSIWNRLIFAKNAKAQTTEVANYAVGKGFELLGTPMNFPSGYEGLSVSVNLKYHLPEVTADLNAGPNSFNDHYPPKPSQFFTIDPKVDNLIVGAEGTKIFLAAGSLLTDNEVVLELIEYYTLEDYLKNGLTTSSNGTMIFSGGVIYLNAVQNDASKNPVKINQAVGLDVEFALGKDNPDMQIFVQDPRSPDELNWILPPKNNVVEDWQMTETLLDPDGNVVSVTVYRSREEWERHRLNDSIAEQNRIKMENVQKIFAFGLINCDAFSDEPMIAYTLDADTGIAANYYLVFTDVRGVMQGKFENNKVSFDRVPAGRRATLFVTTFVNNQPYFYKTTLTPKDPQRPKVKLVQVEESFLERELAALK